MDCRMCESKITGELEILVEAFKNQGQHGQLCEDCLTLCATCAGLLDCLGFNSGYHTLVRSFGDLMVENEIFRDVAPFLRQAERRYLAVMQKQLERKHGANAQKYQQSGSYCGFGKEEKKFWRATGAEVTWADDECRSQGIWPYCLCEEHLGLIRKLTRGEIYRLIQDTHSGMEPLLRGLRHTVGGDRETAKWMDRAVDRYHEILKETEKAMKGRVQ